MDDYREPRHQIPFNLNPQRELRIVRLIEPELCESCRFASLTDVRTRNGDVKTILRCRRLDCDNWEMIDNEPVEEV